MPAIVVHNFYIDYAALMGQVLVSQMDTKKEEYSVFWSKSGTRLLVTEKGVTIDAYHHFCNLSVYRKNIVPGEKPGEQVFHLEIPNTE